MRIHNDSLLRVVFTARMVGGLLVTIGVALTSVAVISAIRYPDNAFPWSRLLVGLCSILPGLILFSCASNLDRGRIRAFYAISVIAVLGVLFGGMMIMATMKPHSAAILVPMLALSVACGIAWHPAESLRRANARAYIPPKPVPSTTVVIPPPPSRKGAQAMQTQPPADAPGAMVIEIRRA